MPVSVDLDELEAQEAQAASIYTVVDEEDPIDVMVGKAMVAKFTGVTVNRQAPGMYLINGKSLTLALDGEQQD